MRYVIKVATDVQIYTPAVIVGVSTALGNSLMCVSAWPVGKAAVVKVWFQVWFQRIPPAKYTLY